MRPHSLGPNVVFATLKLFIVSPVVSVPSPSSASARPFVRPVVRPVVRPQPFCPVASVLSSPSSVLCPPFCRPSCIITYITSRSIRRIITFRLSSSLACIVLAFMLSSHFDVVGRYFPSVIFLVLQDVCLFFPPAPECVMVGYATEHF